MPTDVWGGQWAWVFWPGAIFGGGAGTVSTPTPALVAGTSAVVDSDEAPIDWLLDDEGDLVVDSDMHFARGLAAHVQDCRCAVKDFLSEWFLNQADGLDYWGVLLGKKYDARRVQAEFRRVLNRVPGVVQVLKLNTRLEGATRTLVVDWKIKTDLGTVFADGGSFSEQ